MLPHNGDVNVCVSYISKYVNSHNHTINQISLIVDDINNIVTEESDIVDFIMIRKYMWVSVI